MIVLVTGCSSGFGLTTALSFARRGDTVYASMRDVAKAGALKDAAASEGLKVNVIQLDVTDDASVAAAVAEIVERDGGVDVLVNNAGVGGRAAVETFPDALVRGVFETNFFGVLRLIRTVLPSMRERGSGTIVNVSSLAGLMAVPYNSMYSASKHALEAMSEALALEVQPFGVRVALVEPGYYRTNIGDNVIAQTELSPDSPYHEAEQRAVEAVAPAVARGGDPQEVADAIVAAATSPSPQLRTVLGGGASGLLRAPEDAEWATIPKRVALPKPTN